MFLLHRWADTCIFSSPAFLIKWAMVNCRHACILLFSFCLTIYPGNHDISTQSSSTDFLHPCRTTLCDVPAYWITLLCKDIEVTFNYFAITANAAVSSLVHMCFRIVGGYHQGIFLEVGRLGQQVSISWFYSILFYSIVEFLSRKLISVCTSTSNIWDISPTECVVILVLNFFQYHSWEMASQF